MPPDVSDDVGKENHKCGLGCKRNINSQPNGWGWKEEPGNAFTLQSRIHFSRLKMTHFKLKSWGVVTEVEGEGKSENSSTRLLITKHCHTECRESSVGIKCRSHQTNPSPRAMTHSSEPEFERKRKLSWVSELCTHWCLPEQISSDHKRWKLVMCSLLPFFCRYHAVRWLWVRITFCDGNPFVLIGLNEVEGESPSIVRAQSNRYSKSSKAAEIFGNYWHLCTWHVDWILQELSPRDEISCLLIESIIVSLFKPAQQLSKNPVNEVDWNLRN